jgi:nucleoid-associated protein YgaU
MSLEKLTIQYEKGAEGRFDGKIEALFNPNQLSFTRTVSWERLDTAQLPKSAGYGNVQFKSAAPETLTISLFFDTYGGDPHGGTVSGMLGSLFTLPTRPPSVLKYTDAVAALAQLDRELHRPPVCKLSWGRTTLFQGVAQSVTRKLELFLEDGTPVRASVECSFMEIGAGVELHSADVAKQYIVRPGDTLMGIAAELYGDVSLWRVIAAANRIDNPRRLTPGRVLAIPKLG